MNYFITHLLNDLLGESFFFDALVLVFAEMIPWFVGLIFLIFIVFSYKRTIQPFFFSTTILIIAAFLNPGLKILFNVKRPFEMFQTIEPLFVTYGFGSFPSSHAFFFATMTVLSFFFTRNIALFFVITSFLIGVSRIIAGVHSMYDIIGGWVLGTLFGLLSVWFYRKIIRNEPESSTNS